MDDVIDPPYNHLPQRLLGTTHSPNTLHTGNSISSKLGGQRMYKQNNPTNGVSTKDVRFAVSALKDKPPAPPAPSSGMAGIERRGMAGSSVAMRIAPGRVVPPDVQVSPQFANYDDVSPQASLRVKKPALRRSLPNTDTDDLSQMELLNQDQILNTLKKRHNSGILQTYISDILISVNPYKETGMYTADYHRMYTNVATRQENTPHIFWVADKAFQCLRDTHTDQVILVSGESGAGKTESTKNMIKHFTHISKSDIGGMDEKIVMVNPLLEAFGNAQTFFNKNSSRFGKLIEISFTPSGHLVTAQIIDYLLEKSRVVGQPSTDRNFHIFYYIFAGMGTDKLKGYYLDNANDYRILTCGEKRVFEDDNHVKHCKKMYRDIGKIFSKLGFNEDDVTTIYTALAAVLHITNIEFIDASTIDETKDGALIGDDYHLKIVGDLLLVDVDTLNEAFVNTTSTVNGELVVARKTVDQAYDVRDALAKRLYVRLFGWLVRQVNLNLQPDDPNTTLHAQKIAILDFAGFENFDLENGFEQFCINIANEQLQHFFNQTLFAREQEEYSQEGVDWTRIEFPDNSHLLTLFLGKPTGMLELLDDESGFPKANHETFISKCRTYFGETGSFQTIPGHDSTFCIRHYADDVLYNAIDFLPKNRDTFSSNVKDCMLNSENEFINDLFAAEPGADGQISRTHSTIRARSVRRPRRPKVIRGNSKSPREMLMERAKQRRVGSAYISGSIRIRTTMSQYFKTSLKEMMKKLQSSNPFFVRCIKPNNNQVPEQFDSDLVQRQLRYNGIFELAKIRQVGYPVRMVFRDFTDRFKLAAPPKAPTTDSKAMCQAIVGAHCSPEDYVLGRSKVFLKDNVPDQLRGFCEKKAGIMLQSLVRCRLAFEKLGKLKRAKKRMELANKQEEPSQFEIQSNPSRDDSQLPTYDNSIGVAGTSNTEPEVTKYTEDSDSGESVNYTESDEEDEEEEIYSSIREEWDVAQVVQREGRSASESFEGLLRFIKLLLYFFIFSIVLVCAMGSQASVLVLTSSFNVPAYRKGALFQLLAIIIIPHIFIVITSFFTMLFGRQAWPKLNIGIGLMLVEIVHVVGLNILIFRVLPEYDTVYALATMYAVCAIPAFLKLIFATTSGELKQRGLIFSLDLMALLIQIGAVAATVLVRTLENATYRNADETDTKTLPENMALYWQVPMGLIMTSIKWWENYVDTDRWCLKLLSVKKEIQLSRTKTSLATSLVNIIATIICLVVMERSEGRSLSLNFQQHTEKRTPLFNSTTNMTNFNNMSVIDIEGTAISLSPGIAQVLLGLIGYYFVALAAKLLMQRFSSWLPMLLSAPLLAILITLQCEGHIPLIPLSQGFSVNPLCSKWTEGARSWHIPICIMWWLSAIWISIHSFFPKSERLALVEKLFVTPFYTGPLFVQSCLLNRRRNQQEVMPNVTGNYELNEIQSDTSARSYETNKAVYGKQQQLDSIAKRKLAGRHAVPIIYACATMWHESISEMKALLKSLLRMDSDQSARKLSVEKLKVTDPDYYEFEGHVFFDDAYEFNDDDQTVPNQFVRDMVANIDEAASAVMQVAWKLRPPTKKVTPYGAQLVWTLPGGNLLIVHLKDKDKIRHKKRWSQVMYMYYLLGYRLFGIESEVLMTEASGHAKKTDIANKAREGNKASWADIVSKTTEHFGKSQLFSLMETALIHQAENTFLLALDGDVDFKPDAVRLLLDQMMKNQKTGAACGRIHPIGQGPMVWYQQFEYAIGHWFQKATEHVLGCVLCSPGCFSMFRGSALLDDNIMKRYTAISEEPVHFLQYDQGEDRWLCTLLLQQGYRVDYTAASDALTSAPETFDEFFNQRRRWVPSTIANVADLLSDFKNTVNANDNISYLYIAYQMALLFSTILGPATIVLAIANAIWSVLQVDLWVAYLLSLIPVVFYLAICFTVKQKTQLVVGALISVIYAGIMVIVAVGIIQSLVTDGFLNSSLLFLLIVTVCFIIAGVIHPYEFGDLPPGIIYYLCIPAGYLVLMIYSLCNMHVVSWGTREVAKKKSRAEIAQEVEDAKAKQELELTKPKKKGFFSWSRESILRDVKDIIGQVFRGKGTDNQDEQLKFLKKIHEDLKKLTSIQTGKAILTSSSSDDESSNAVAAEEEVMVDDAVMDEAVTREPSTKKKKPKKASKEVVPVVDDPHRPKWIYDGENYGYGAIVDLDPHELDFWVKFIKKYLKPLKKDADKEAKVNAGLINMRNNASFGFWFFNILWIIFNFMIQRDDRLVIEIAGQKTQPQGMVFLIFFMILLFLQMVCMFIHRWGTFLQVISITELCKKKNKNWMTEYNQEHLSAADAIEFSREIQKPMSRFINKPLPEFDIAGTASGNGAAPEFGANGLRRRNTKLADVKTEDIHKRVNNHIQAFKQWETATESNDIPPPLPPRVNDVENGGNPMMLSIGQQHAHPLSRALKKTVRYADDINRSGGTMKRKYRATQHHKKSRKLSMLPATPSTEAEKYELAKQKYRSTRRLHRKQTQRNTMGTSAALHANSGGDGDNDYDVDNAFERYFDNRIDRFLEG